MNAPGRRQAWVATAFVLAILLTAVFSYRAGRSARHMQNEPVMPWMSVEYIAYSHRVPQQALFDALALKGHPHDHRSLRAIARDRGIPVDEAISKVEDAIARERKKRHPERPR